MATTNSTPFDDLLNELPDGAFWPTGKFFKRWLTALIADRIRPDNATLTETPSARGRMVRVNGSASELATPEAFFATNASSGGALKVGLTAGDINGHTIAAQTFTVTVSGKIYAKITDDSDYLETTWEVLNGASVPASDEHHGYVELASYTVASGVLTVTPAVGRPGRFGVLGHLNSTAVEHWWG